MVTGFNPVRWFLGLLGRLWIAAFGYDVFISYARGDGVAFAREVKRSMEHRYFVFLDEEGIHAGEQYSHTIEKEIRRARCLVVLMTEHAVESPWVKRECNAFRKHHQPRPRIAPVFFHPVNPKSLPPDWNWIAGWHGHIIGAEAGSVSNSGTAGTLNAISRTANDVFTGVRKRQAFQAALTVLPVLVAGLFVSIGFQLNQGEMRSRHLQAATAAENQLDFDRAALALSQAKDAGAGNPAFREHLANTLARTRLLPYRILDVPSGWRLMALAENYKGPVLILRDGDRESTTNGRIAIVDSSGRSCFIPAPHELQPQCVIKGSNAYVAASGKLHRIDLNSPKLQLTTTSTDLPSGMMFGGFDSVEIEVQEETVTVLGRTGIDKPTRILVYDATTLGLLDKLSIPEVTNAETMVTLSPGPDFAFVVRRTLGRDLELQTLRFDKTGLKPMKDFVPDLRRTRDASIFSLYFACLAPSNDQAFVAVHELNMAGTPEQRANGIRWVALDLTYPRMPWTLESGIVELQPTRSYGAYEAVFRLESRELRALQFKSFVVLDRPSVTLAPNAMAWTLASKPKDNLSFQAYVTDRKTLTMYDDLRPMQRVNWREALGLGAQGDGIDIPDPLRLLTTQNDRFLGLELSGSANGMRQIIVWRQQQNGLSMGKLTTSELRRVLFEWPKSRLQVP